MAISMALNRKYANLPDLDSAPDIYETPELTDDNSTAPTVAQRTHSEDEFNDIDDDAPGVSRSRLRIDDARSRFMSTVVDAYDVDFSDRVDGKRKSYKASSRRRVKQNGTVEYGEISGDEESDDDDTLERRITWLRRQVQEAKDEVAKRRAASESQSNGEAVGEKRLKSLSQALDELSLPEATEILATQEPNGTSAAELKDETPADLGNKATYSVTYAPSYEQSHALAKAADFDRRLVLLENGLGIANSVPEIGERGLPRAILPTLDMMEKQIATLSQASTSNLDAISRRVRSLAQDQDKLNDSREKAKMLREELGKHTGNTPPGDDSEQEAKINALYGILPTIESLTPMLPPLLDRLRSLRAIHAEAATASQTLEDIEEQQVKMASELTQWREGLEKMEVTMEKGEKSIEGNVKVMEGWVKELEEKMAKLA